MFWASLVILLLVNHIVVSLEEKKNITEKEDGVDEQFRRLRKKFNEGKYRHPRDLW